MKLERISKYVESRTFTMRLPVKTIELIRARAVELNMTQGCLVDLAVKFEARTKLLELSDFQKKLLETEIKVGEQSDRAVHREKLAAYILDKKTGGGHVEDEDREEREEVEDREEEPERD